LESIYLEISQKNTTWFDDYTDDKDIEMITDLDGGLLISQRGYYYPVWVDGVSRSDICHSEQKAKSLIKLYT
jgi:hypothetical protein